ncbi:MAG: hypothetical protein WCR01_12900 [Bacteroidota bacterium]
MKQQKPSEIYDFHLNLSNNSSKMANTFRIKEFEKYLSIPFIVCITLLAYIPSLSNGVFCWDDKVVALAPLVQNLSINKVFEYFSTYHAGLYHPLTTLSFAIDYKIGNGSVFPFHVTNLILHLINTSLIYLLVKNISSIPLLPFFVGLTFGIHPMHVESVAWITSRKDLLYSLFFICSLLSYTGYVKNNANKKLYLLTLLFFIFSCLSKIQSIVLPFLLFVFDYQYKRKFVIREQLIEKIPFILIVFLLGYVNVQAQNQYGYVNFKENYSFIERIFLFSIGFLQYLEKIIFPFQIAIFYPFPFKPSQNLPGYYLLFPAGVGVFLFGTFMLILKSKKEEIFGLLFFLINILIVLLISNYREYIIANKYTYLALTGIFITIGSTGYWLIQRFQKFRMIFFTMISAYLIMLTMMTYKQNRLWNSPLKLFTYASDKYPDCSIIFNTLGSISTDSGMYDKSLEYLNKAIVLDRDNLFAFYNRALTEYKLDKNEDALKDFNHVIYFNPSYNEAYFGRANVYLKTGEYELALADYSYLINRVKNHIGAWQNRAIVKGNLGDFEGALIDLNEVIVLNPSLGSSYYLRGIAKFELGIDGCEDLNKAVSLNYTGSTKALEHYCK